MQVRLGRQSVTNQNSVLTDDENQERESGGDDEPVMVNKKNWTSWNKNQNNPFPGGRPNCPPQSCLPSAAKAQNSEKKSCSCSAVSRSHLKKNLVQGKTKFCGDNPLCQPPDKSSVSCPRIKSPFGKIQTSGNDSIKFPSCKIKF